MTEITKKQESRISITKPKESELNDLTPKKSPHSPTDLRENQKQVDQDRDQRFQLSVSINLTKGLLQEQPNN